MRSNMWPGGFSNSFAVNFVAIMSQRKLRADKIFDGQEFSNGVLVTKADGQIEDIIAVENAGDGVEIFEGILSPGFINCHCHLELSHMRGLIPERIGLVDF